MYIGYTANVFCVAFTGVGRLRLYLTVSWSLPKIENAFDSTPFFV